MRFTVQYALKSASGSVHVEIQDAAGKPLEGFTLADCPEHFGDTIEQSVNWKSGVDVNSLSGRAVRLRFQLKDANLYSFQFQNG